VVPVFVFIGRSDFMKFRDEKHTFYYEEYSSTLAEGASNLMAKSVCYSVI
jgi:hypothetical protein